MPKAEKLTVAKRIQEVTQLILHGAETDEIGQYASQNEWGISRRQVYRYITHAYKRIVKILDRDREELLGRHLAQRRGLYARCMKIQDYKTALQVLRDEAQLMGLYPAARMEMQMEATVNRGDQYRAMIDRALSTPEGCEAMATLTDIMCSSPPAEEGQAPVTPGLENPEESPVSVTEFLQNLGIPAP